VADEVIDFRIASNVFSGRQLATVKSVECGLVVNLACQAHAGAHNLPILIVVEVIVLNDRRVA
jgi:hypothetical protein